MEPRFLTCDDSALSVEFGDLIDRGLSECVMSFRDAVEEAGLPGIGECVPTYRSLLVRYDPLETSLVKG